MPLPEESPPAPAEGFRVTRFFPFLPLLLVLTPPTWETHLSWFLAPAAWIMALAVWRRFSQGLLLWPWLTLFAVFGLSGFASLHWAEAANQLGLHITFFLLFITSMILARDDQQLADRLTRLLLAAGALLSLYAWYQHVYGLEALHQKWLAGQVELGPQAREVAGRLASARAFGFFVHPNALAGYLAMMLPLAAGRLLRGTGRPGWPLATLAICGLGLYASGSVAGSVAGLLGLVVVAVLRPAAVRGRALGVIAAGLVLTAAVLLQRGGVSWLAAFPQRAALWSHALQMLDSRWWLGLGPGLLAHGLAQAGQAPVGNAHSAFIHLAAETGLLGLAAFGWLLLVLARQAVKGWPIAAMRAPGTALGLAGAVCAGLAHAAVDMDWQVLKTAAVFWCLTGALVGLGQPAEGAAPPGAARPLLRFLYPLFFLAISLLPLWGGGKRFIINISLYIGIGLLAYLHFSQNQKSRTIPYLGWLGGLLLWGVMAAMVSLYPGAALPGLALAAAGLAMYVLAVRSPGLHGPLLQALSVAAPAAAGMVLVASLNHAGERIAAGWPNPNLMAAFLALGLLVNAGLGLRAGLAAWQRWRYSLSAGLLVLALLATGSIAGLLNVLAGGAVLLWLRFGRSGWRWILAAGLALAMAASLVPLATGQRLSQPAAFKSLLYERAGMARAALQMAASRPLCGWGPGNFAKAFEHYKFPDVRGLARFGKFAEFSHNEFLHTLAVLGLPGALLLLGLLFQVGRAFREDLRNAPRDSLRLAAWSGLAGGLAHGLFDFNWHVPGLFIWYLLLLAVAGGSGEAWEARPAADRLSSVASRGLLVVLVAAVVMSATRPLLASHYLSLGQAQRQKQRPGEAQASFKAAAAWQPLAAEAHDGFGQVATDLFSRQGSEEAFRAGQQAFARAQQLDRLDAYSHRHRGMLYAAAAAGRKEYLEAAAGQYRQAIRKAPYNAVLRFELGNIHRDAGQMTAAIQAWSRAAALEPHYAAAWSNLGSAQALAGEVTAAATSLSRAAALQPLASQVQGKYEMELLALDYTVIHFNLGNLYERSGRPELARASYQKVLALEPGNARARSRLQALKEKGLE